jgi:hypothetical protein
MDRRYVINLLKNRFKGYKTKTTVKTSSTLSPITLRIFKDNHNISQGLKMLEDMVSENTPQDDCLKELTVTVSLHFVVVRHPELPLYMEVVRYEI